MWFTAWLLETRTTRANGPAVGNLSLFISHAAARTPDEWKITCLVLFHKFYNVIVELGLCFECEQAKQRNPLAQW